MVLPVNTVSDAAELFRTRLMWVPRAAVKVLFWTVVLMTALFSDSINKAWSPVAADIEPKVTFVNVMRLRVPAVLITVKLFSTVPLTLLFEMAAEPVSSVKRTLPSSAPASSPLVPLMTVLSIVKLATDEPRMAKSPKSLSCMRLSDTLLAFVSEIPVALFWIVPPVPPRRCRAL